MVMLRTSNNIPRLSPGWGIFIVAAIFYAYEFVQRLSPTAMIPQLIADLHISAASMGHLSAFYYYAYASFQLPAGILTDHGDIRRILGYSALLVAIGSLLQASAHALSIACLARTLIGIGSAFAFVSCLKLSASWFPAHRLPFLIGVINLCGVLGAIISGAPLTWLTSVIGWRETLYSASILGFLIAGLIFKTVKRGPLYTPPITKITRGHIAEDLSRILSSKQTWLAALYGALLVAPLAAFSELWSIPFLIKAYHLSPEQATFSNSLVFLGIAIGGPCIGWIASNQYFALKKLLRYCTCGALGCFLSILLCTQMPLWILSLALIGYGAFTSHMLLCFSFATLQHPPSVNGLAIGFTNTAVMLGGSLLQPCIGYLLDYRLIHTAHGRIEALQTMDYQIVLSILPLFLVAALILSYRIVAPPSLDKIRTLPPK